MPKKFRFTLTVEVERDGPRPELDDDEADYLAEDLREQTDSMEIWVNDTCYSVTVVNGPNPVEVAK